MDPHARATGRGCAAALVWNVVGSIAVLLLFGIIALVGVGLGETSLEPHWRIAILGLLLLVSMLVLAAWAIAFSRRRAALLDPAFARAGIAGRAMMNQGRQYHGIVHGRALDAYYVRRGTTLEVYVDTPVATRLAVGTRTAAGTMLRGLVARPEIQLGDPAYAPYSVTAAEPQWAAQLLLASATKPIVQRLLADASGRELRFVELRPGCVVVRRSFLDPDRVQHEDFRALLDDMVALARAAEALPPPAVREASSAFEQRARKNPAGVALVIVFVILGFVLVLALVSAAVVFLSMTSEPASGGRQKHQPAQRRR